MKKSSCSTAATQKLEASYFNFIPLHLIQNYMILNNIQLSSIKRMRR